MLNSKSRPRLGVCRLSIALIVLSSGSACISGFELDLPPDHPSMVDAPSGGALTIPDPAMIPEKTETGAFDAGRVPNDGEHGMGHEGAAKRDMKGREMR